MTISVTHTKVSTIPDGSDTDLIRPSDWNAGHTLTGVGTMAEQNANNVAITGGTITGVTGLGDVTGPASSTDNAVARYDSTTGKLIQNSIVTIDDNGNTSLNAISFDTTPATLPTAPGSLYWDSADNNATLSLIMAGSNAVQQIGEETYFRIKASAAITEGQVVMFTGTVGSSGGLTGAPATGLTASTASYIMGVATHSMALNDWGYVTAFGLVRGIDTTGGGESWVDGQILYYNPSVTGGLTKTAPSAPNAKVQVCAVVHADANGSLFIRPTFGGALGQYEGDVGITTPANGDLLIRNQTDGKWVNSPLTAGTGISVTNAAGSVTVANSSPMTYPGSGIPNSTGSAWGTSYTTTGSGTVVALATSPSFTTPILGTPQSGDFSTGTFTWPTFNQNTTGSAGSVANALTAGSGITFSSGTTYNGSAAITISSSGLSAAKSYAINMVLI